MCEYSGKLIAWLDRELPAGEAADVGQHLSTCPECSGNVAVYRGVSQAFADYRESSVKSRISRRARWLVAGAATVAAVAAGFVIVLLIPRVPQSATPPPAPVVATVTSRPTLDPPAEPVRRSYPRRRRQPILAVNPVLQFAQPQIEIVIPADAMFPPGAVPVGVHFIADVSIGADGSPQGIRLRP